MRKKSIWNGHKGKQNPKIKTLTIAFNTIHSVLEANQCLSYLLGSRPLLFSEPYPIVLRTTCPNFAMLHSELLFSFGFSAMNVCSINSSISFSPSEKI